MQSAIALKGQPIYRQVRAVGINPNCWYPIYWAAQLKPGQVVPAEVWEQRIALYRDQEGQAHALENGCPHKGIELHKGEVKGQHLTCPYHGWEFEPGGTCVHIPYFPAGQKLPCVKARSYPIQERYGILWIFPGEVDLAHEIPLPAVPEYDADEWFLVKIPGEFQAHFSICNENAMDVFHGYLHRDLQGWFNPVLLNLKQTEADVYADYQVSYRGKLTKLLGLSQQEQTTTRTVSIHYQYPHYHSALGDVSSLYLMRLPVGPACTRSFSLLFLRLPLPRPLRRLLRGRFKSTLERLILHRIFLKFLHQDVEMMESEQQNYQANPQRSYVEVNPAIIALQRVMVGQYEKFVQQSERSLNQS
ncbi:aromatic ring-hydroxylating dioxygenase subunit alpha [Romeria aff. gracilis LEGE 07310]|uniref:Aromatic ring-hydroxylating dioxygenase subunit alpha n=1 Tax=Vasconcelosia minhoensis LEGE 07310 TaxID=915328 RepID=A0A8J7DMA5_9CYAN|nr:aromatic ring-hydroxylating dioxygenase subunit alpha [Romeria gracilis]MBE9076220.1 aromatic ring-hydroxylating dioxygenase subunit alpha [Romeria aff. gracilis LEGE 07310]